MIAWLLLAGAILFEIAGTTLLKASNGFARPWLGVASIACYWVCFGLLAYAVTRIPLSVAYAIWAGVGIAGVAVIGWWLFRQPLTVAQIGFMALIVVGAIGLNLVTPPEPATAARPR